MVPDVMQEMQTRQSRLYIPEDTQYLLPGTAQIFIPKTLLVDAGDEELRWRLISRDGPKAPSGENGYSEGGQGGENLSMGGAGQAAKNLPEHLQELQKQGCFWPHSAVKERLLGTELKIMGILYRGNSWWSVNTL